MTRTRDWTKFGVLVAVALLLALAFASVVNSPASTEAQQRESQNVVVGGEPPKIPEARPAAELGEAFIAVAEAVRPGVVFIRSERTVQASRQRQPSIFERFFNDPTFERFFDQQQPRRRSNTGSGFIISDDGYIMTNNHVVVNAERITVRLFDRREFDAELIGSDRLTDVAVIKIDADNLAAVSFGDSDSLRVGEWVLAIGNPLGEAFTFTVTAGIVSAKGRLLQGLLPSNFGIQDFIQTDAAINPGNSGGPLVDIRGRVVGINSAIASRTGLSQGYGFAIPMNLARMVSDQLIAKGHVTRSILGVLIGPASDEDAEAVGLDSIQGVVVSALSGEESPAAKAGIEPGDVIVDLDGEPVNSVAHLQQLIGFRTPGDVVRITLIRGGGERLVLNAELAAAELDQPVARTAARRDDEAEQPPFDRDLGLRVEEVSEQLAVREGIGRENAGLLISRVDPSGPAAGKLSPGLIITHVEDVRVRTGRDLNRALKDVNPGEIVGVRYYRPQVRTSGFTRIRVPER